MPSKSLPFSDQRQGSAGHNPWFPYFPFHFLIFVTYIIKPRNCHSFLFTFFTAQKHAEAQEGKGLTRPGSPSKSVPQPSDPAGLRRGGWCRAQAAGTARPGPASRT